MGPEPARGGFAELDSCVHCGFCLQACPTFRATGDEADGPRGRIELMRALEDGRLDLADHDVAAHLDRCLGCRACEPVCPSGVGYGHGLEAARERLTQMRGVSTLARLALNVLTLPGTSRAAYALARGLRASGLPGRLAGWGRLGFAFGMLAATTPASQGSGAGRAHAPRVSGRHRRHPVPPSPSHTITLFRGCVMEGLFAHVHEATLRTLAVNGYASREVAGQACCGALHAHAGLVEEARALARTNITAFAGHDDPVVVNSAGCGAMLKDYAHLLPSDPEAAAFSERVRDVTELLAARGPIPGAPLDLRVAYDPPCHLLHAQRIGDAPERVLDAVPVLRHPPLQDAAQCCGSAGLFSILQRAMSHAVLAPKIEHLRRTAPQVVATGNPGCAMQIGAGLRAAGLTAQIRHPVELLDESYEAAGYYA